MVSLSYTPDEMVLIRKRDGLLWPAYLREINANSRTAKVDNYRTSNSMSAAVQMDDEVPLYQMYKFYENAPRLVDEASRASFGQNQWLKGTYDRILRSAITLYEEKAAASGQPLNEPERPLVDVIPILKTKSPPPPPPRHYAIRSNIPVPSAQEYSIPIRDAGVKGLKKLYFVHGYDSAKKVFHALGSDKLPQNVGVVCEEHPDWVFTKLFDFFKHWHYIHPRVEEHLSESSYSEIEDSSSDGSSNEDSYSAMYVSNDSAMDTDNSFEEENMDEEQAVESGISSDLGNSN